MYVAPYLPTHYNIYNANYYAFYYIRYNNNNNAQPYNLPRETLNFITFDTNNDNAHGKKFTIFRPPQAGSRRNTCRNITMYVH